MDQKLKKETVAKIANIDQSLIYWSVQLGKVTMSLRDIEHQISDLYNFKKSSIIEDLQSQNIDIQDCEVQSIDQETVRIIKTPKQELAHQPTEPPGK